MNLFPALIYDTETTDLPQYGKDNPADAEHQPRIVQIAASLVDVDHRILSSFDRIIKPDGWTISFDAQRIHGITLDQCEREGVPILDAMMEWEALHNGASITVAFNHAFDSKLTRGELRRLGRNDRYGELPDFCCMWGSRNLCGKLPTLALAAKTVCGIEHTKATGAHSAPTDRDVTIKLYLELVRRGVVVPKVRDLEDKNKPAAAKPKREPVPTIVDNDPFGVG